MRLPLPAIVSPADVSSNVWGRVVHPRTDASGRPHWRRREKGVFGRGRPWQGGHGQLLGGLGSDAPCVGGSDLRGQGKQVVGRGIGSWGTLVLGGVDPSI
jgi:hypothetical protein